MRWIKKRWRKKDDKCFTVLCAVQSSFRDEYLHFSILKLFSQFPWVAPFKIVKGYSCSIQTLCPIHFVHIHVDTRRVVSFVRLLACPIHSQCFRRVLHLFFASPCFKFLRDASYDCALFHSGFRGWEKTTAFLRWHPNRRVWSINLELVRLNEWWRGNK